MVVVVVVAVVVIVGCGGCKAVMWLCGDVMMVVRKLVGQFQ